MLKKLICSVWGHKTVVKAYTGRSIQTQNYLGQDLTVLAYVWTKSDFCLRCGQDQRAPAHESTKG